MKFRAKDLKECSQFRMREEIVEDRVQTLQIVIQLNYEIPWQIIAVIHSISNKISNDSNFTYKFPVRLQ